MAILRLHSGRGLSSEGSFEPVAIWSVSDRLIEDLSSDETAGEGICDRFLKLLLADPAGCDIEKRAERRRDPEPGPLFDIRWGMGCLVEHAPGGGGLSELRWNRQMDFAGEELRESVEYQRRIVGDNRLWLVLPVSTPEAHPHKVIVFAGRHAGEAVETVLDPLEVSNGGMILKVFVLITYGFSLFCSKVAALLVCESRKCLDRFSGRTGHAKTSE